MKLGAQGLEPAGDEPRQAARVRRSQERRRPPARAGSGREPAGEFLGARGGARHDDELGRLRGQRLAHRRRRFVAGDHRHAGFDRGKERADRPAESVELRSRPDDERPRGAGARA